MLVSRLLSPRLYMPLSHFLSNPSVAGLCVSMPLQEADRAHQAFASLGSDHIAALEAYNGYAQLKRERTPVMVVIDHRTFSVTHALMLRGMWYGRIHSFPLHCPFPCSVPCAQGVLRGQLPQHPDPRDDRRPSPAGGPISFTCASPPTSTPRLLPTHFPPSGFAI